MVARGRADLLLLVILGEAKGSAIQIAQLTIFVARSVGADGAVAHGVRGVL